MIYGAVTRGTAAEPRTRHVIGMLRPPVWLRARALALAVPLAGACGKHDSTSPSDPTGQNPFGLTTTGPGLLSVSPIDTTQWMASTPLGSLAPPGHVLPTDHVYVYFVDAWSGNQQTNDCSKRAVRAAGSGVVTLVLVTEAAGDTKVMIQMTKTFGYYYDHVILKSGIQQGTHVAAGDTIGTTTGRCPSFDLGVWDLDVTLPGIITPVRYADQNLHAASPYKYFPEPLRSYYYRHVRLIDGVPANKDGRIDYGIAGKLSGDWFHSSIAVDRFSTGTSDGWAHTIGFVYDWYSGATRVSIGGTIAGPGLYAVAAADPDPATVSTASGPVAYQLHFLQGTSGVSWLLVQMTADDKIRVEPFATGASRPTAFTTAAQNYLR